MYCYALGVESTTYFNCNAWFSAIRFGFLHSDFSATYLLKYTFIGLRLDLYFYTFVFRWGVSWVWRCPLAHSSVNCVRDKKYFPESFYLGAQFEFWHICARYWKQHCSSLNTYIMTQSPLMANGHMLTSQAAFVVSSFRSGMRAKDGSLKFHKYTDGLTLLMYRQW